MNAATAHDLIEMQLGPVTPILSKALRSMIIAPPGKKLIGGDFAGIESRVNAWMAGEEWKLEAFRAYDAGVGPDTYKLAYANTFNVPIEDITAAHRRIGKTMELALGFGGSLGAWLRFDPDPMFVTKVVREQFYGTEKWLKATDQYDKSNSHYGLSADQWISVKIIVNGWRESHPRITQSWWDRQDAAIEAVDAPGNIVRILDGKIQYLCAEGFLWCRGPSGKLLAYAKPRLVETREEWLVDADGEMYPADEFTADELERRIAEGGKLESSQARVQVAFSGKNQKTGAWGTQRLYGGLQTNNDVQMTARELLRCAMENVELFDYPIVLHVHDELICEVDEAFGSAEHFESLMSILPEWIQGLPLSAKAWESKRYVK